MATKSRGPMEASIGADLAIEARPIRFLLLGLLALWSGLLFGGMVLGTLVEDQTYRVPTWARMSSSATLVAAGWVWYVVADAAAGGALSVAASGVARRYALGIALGMTLGFIGDLCNASLIPLPEPVIGGIVAFGLGHVAYILAITVYGNRAGLGHPRPRLWSQLAWLVLGIVGWWLVMRSLPQWSVVVWASLPYTLLLATTAACATALAAQDRRFIPLGIGAALFFVSDLVLAIRLFHGDFYRAGDLVWMLYGPGQMLIVYSVGSAIARLRFEPVQS